MASFPQEDKPVSFSITQNTVEIPQAKLFSSWGSVAAGAGSVFAYTTGTFGPWERHRAEVPCLSYALRGYQTP